MNALGAIAVVTVSFSIGLGTGWLLCEWWNSIDDNIV